MLYKDGALPQTDYITTQKGIIQSTNADEFVDSLIWSLGGLDEAQQEKVKEYHKLFIQTNNKHPKPFTWAFIAWSNKKLVPLKSRYY